MKLNAIKDSEARNANNVKEWKDNLLHGVLLDLKSNTVSTEDIGNDLDSYYRYLDCDLVDIAVRKIGGQYFDIICDDEALLKDDPVPTAADPEHHPMLFGNLFICKDDGEGNLIGLTDAECAHVHAHVAGYIHDQIMTPVIIDVEY